MTQCNRTRLAQVAILTLAEIKAAADAFDRGDTNVFATLDTIFVAVDAYQDAARPKAVRRNGTRSRSRSQPRRDAA